MISGTVGAPTNFARVDVLNLPPNLAFPLLISSHLSLISSSATKRQRIMSEPPAKRSKPSTPGVATPKENPYL
jgi:hypothetical protein